jgi:hypothetical protein
MPVGSNIELENIYTTYGYSAGSLNADLIAVTDVSAYKWIGLYVGSSVYVGTLTFQGSFDNVDWIDITMYRLGNLDGAHSVSSVYSETTTLFGAPIRFPLFRCRMTGYTSGAATAVLELRSEGLAGLTLTATNGAVGVLQGQYYIGATVNDGTASMAIAAGTVADTVVYAGKSMLGGILVTTAGVNSMLVYDNATVGSGTIVGLVPPSAAVTGIAYSSGSPCANGIVVKGNATNPAVTIFYTNIN